MVNLHFFPYFYRAISIFRKFCEKTKQEISVHINGVLLHSRSLSWDQYFEISIQRSVSHVVDTARSVFKDQYYKHVTPRDHYPEIIICRSVTQLLLIGSNIHCARINCARIHCARMNWSNTHHIPDVASLNLKLDHDFRPLSSTKPKIFLFKLRMFCNSVVLILYIISKTICFCFAGETSTKDALSRISLYGWTNLSLVLLAFCCLIQSIFVSLLILSPLFVFKTLCFVKYPLPFSSQPSDIVLMLHCQRMCSVLGCTKLNNHSANLPNLVKNRWEMLSTRTPQDRSWCYHTG